MTRRACSLCGKRLAVTKPEGGIYACLGCDKAGEWFRYRRGICRRNDGHGSCRGTLEKGTQE